MDNVMTQSRLLLNANYIKGLCPVNSHLLIKKQVCNIYKHCCNIKYSQLKGLLLELLVYTGSYLGMNHGILN